jgi:carboxymethylenebutenolidase
MGRRAGGVPERGRRPAVVSRSGSRMIVTRRAALAAFAFCALPAAPRAQGRLTFLSGGAQIEVERYDAGSGGSRPAVMLLHGSDGPTPRYRAAARLLASAGYHAFLVHYLDRTGQSRASFATIGRNLSAWISTAREAVGFVAHQPGVKPAPIGVLGISLGGGLALAAAQAEPRVGAVVNYFGFVPAAFDPGGRLPPVLVLHGARDRIVPVQYATALKAILEARGIPHEVRIYPDQGHGFTGAAAVDASRRITAFLARHLGG